ncbi:hypothetical protein FFLO_05027 [Filobasidium floriforme]|uniref:Cysteine-rich PDZ-binding protein n=1 Tax=Filobasidium floriforme TaxID=5210 RepID=A0A8K0JHM5_9TREE|nr:uncharacterized protein HD553DRAFT_319301 [Filobasidium floriforme]KAG7530428.1 hypothetical protein FFLO_05027 [Filobasidium floriforme]KAH8078555.1 hypothetical protein HD553DRAFT_319301 [Filobasidium floriforme]
MVCKKCEKKLSTVAAPAPGKASTSKNRSIGENKLLTAKKRGTPYGTGKPCIECKVRVVFFSSSLRLFPSPIIPCTLSTYSG